MPNVGPSKSPGARFSHYGSTIMEEMTDMVMHEGLNGFYHRQRVCCRCGKIFRIPPTGRYPYIMVRHGHNLYFCGPTCKHKYEEAEQGD